MLLRTASRTEKLAAAIAVSAMLPWLALLLTFGFGRDHGIYATVAAVMLDGGMPYRDAWDFKPPGIYYVYAAVRAVLGFRPRDRLLAPLARTGAALALYAGLFAIGWLWNG